MSNAHLNVANFLVMHISDYLLLVLFSLNRINGILELLDFACIIQYSHMKHSSFIKLLKLLFPLSESSSISILENTYLLIKVSK